MAAKVGDPPDREIKPEFKLKPISEALQPPPPMRWLLQDYLPPETLCMMFGASASGKSLIALDVSACIATGRSWNGLSTTQGGVVYLAGEGHYGIGKRLMAWAINHDCVEGLENAPMAISERGASLIDDNGMDDVIEAINEFEANFETPALIVIDTLNRNLGVGDENSARDMAKLVANLDFLRRNYSATILLVHHTGKKDGNSARGSSALRAAMDIELKVEEKSGERILSMTKMKDYPEVKNQAFQLKPVELPWAMEDGSYEKSVVLEHVGTVRRQPDNAPAENTRMAISALKAAIASHGVPAPWIDPADSTPFQVVADEHWRSAFFRAYAKAYPKNAKGSDRRAYNRAKKDLSVDKKLDDREGYFWLLNDAAKTSKPKETE